MHHYTTKQVAELARINRVTLQRWLKDGKVTPSETVGTNGGTIHLWSRKDVRDVKDYKKNHYRKGRGRKKQKR